jgi:hypothetical protein
MYLIIVLYKDSQAGSFLEPPDPNTWLNNPFENMGNSARIIANINFLDIVP